MHVRWLGLAAVLLVAGCAQAPAGPVVIPTVSGQAPATTTVAEWLEAGGDTSAGWLAIRASRLIVYADGTAIADANRTLALTRDELTDLVGRLRQGLAGLDAHVKSRGAELVMDATTTVLRVRLADGGVQSVDAYALSLDTDLDYPGRLVAATNLMKEMRQRVADHGTAYTANAVRVVAELGGGGTSVPEWPATVPVPSGASGVYVLDRTEAAPVVAQWPTGSTDGYAWPEARLPDGTIVAVAWRYLLPSE